MIPETRYTRSGGVNIAYQVFGQGETDIVCVPGWFTNVESTWEVSRAASFYRELASFARVILFDKRGTGMSDRDGQAYVLEDRMDDVRAVMDAANSERAVLLGMSEGGPMCILFAATYPERTRSLIILSSYARRVSAPDYPWGTEPQAWTQLTQMLETDFAEATAIGARAPSAATDPLLQRQWSKYMRQSASPGTAVRYAKMNGRIDVRPILASIRVPALIMHASRDRTVNVENGKYLARNIESAEYVELDSDDHIAYWTDAADQVVADIRRFVTGQQRDVSVTGVVCTVLFTDIVDSTRIATKLGDVRWKNLIQEHHDMVRRELDTYRGKEIDTAGDGFFASFDGPARAIRCADAIRNAVRALGIEVRCGLHTGECERSGEKLAGIAVHIGARVAGLASPGEILVSQTVRDLVAGSGFEFEPRGAQVLKGVPGEWHLFAVEG